MPALASYTSAYFYSDPADKGMVFWCPENGAHTSGSSYPRSELRQQPDFDLSPSRHVLNVSIVVQQTSPTQSITIGQAHIDGVSGHCSIFVELEWTKGNIVAHLRDKNCNGVNKVVGTGYALGDTITYSIIVTGNAAQIFTDKDASMKPYAYTWLPTNTPVYFKAGNYLQVRCLAAAPFFPPRPALALLTPCNLFPRLFVRRRTAGAAPQWGAK